MDSWSLFFCSHWLSVFRVSSECLSLHCTVHICRRLATFFNISPQHYFPPLPWMACATVDPDQASQGGSESTAGSLEDIKPVCHSDHRTRLEKSMEVNCNSESLVFDSFFCFVAFGASCSRINQIIFLLSFIVTAWTEQKNEKGLVSWWVGTQVTPWTSRTVLVQLARKPTRSTHDELIM